MLDQFIKNYIRSDSGEMFSQAVWKKPKQEQNKIWKDFFTEASFAGTSSPAQLGTMGPFMRPEYAGFVRRLGTKLNQKMPITLQEVNELIKIYGPGWKSKSISQMLSDLGKELAPTSFNIRKITPDIPKMLPSR